MRVVVFVLAFSAAIIAVLVVFLARLGHLGSAAAYFDCSFAGLTSIYGLVEARLLSRGRNLLRPPFAALLVFTGLSISVIRVWGDFVPVMDAATSRILGDPHLIEEATRQWSPPP